MFSLINQIVNNINRTRVYLILANVFLVFFLILFGNLGVLPLPPGNFVFVVMLVLALALYRPSWAFLFFIGTIPLENINLAPMAWGLAIRPYQLLGAAAILGVLFRHFSGKLYFKLLKPQRLDYLLIIFILSGLLSALFWPDKNVTFKIVFILSTFFALYALVRNYIQTEDDVKKVIPFVLSSGMVITFYGIWQNIRFLQGLNGFEVMPGRPNSTFTEPDWLGMYLVLLLSVIYTLWFHFIKKDNSGIDELKIQNAKIKITIQNSKLLWLFIYLILIFILLVLTVSRSAWLGAAAVTVIFLWIFFTDLRFKNWRWKETIYLKLKIVASLIISLAIVYIFHLTNFQLGNRIQSTGTGLQKITIACENRDAINRVSTDTVIENVAELEKYGCRHINLEDIEKEKAEGKEVLEIYRHDPNVKIRSVIYQKSWQEIKQHSILGIGWGRISGVLGTDERGISLNSSNLFLEVWLGSGIVGLFMLVIFLGYIFFSGIKRYFYSRDHLSKTMGLFIIISWFAIIIPNLFNAGILLGFFWVWLAISQVKSGGKLESS